MIKVNLTTLECTREPVPACIKGLAIADLRDLSWVDKALGFDGFGWWNEVDVTPEFDATTHTFDGTESFTADLETYTVKVVRGVRAKTDDEINAEISSRTPASITQRQCRLHLSTFITNDGQSNLYKDVCAAIVTMGDESQIEWEFANTIQRNNPLITAIQQAFGKDDRWMNQFFIDAALI